MLLLALDTATDRGSLALLEDDRLVGETFLDTPGTFLVHLLPALDKLLTRTGRALSEVQAIAVSQGPGNFTGLRLGLAMADAIMKATAEAHDAELFTSDADFRGVEGATVL